MTTQEPSGVILVEGRSLSQAGVDFRKKPLTIVVDGQVMQGQFVSATSRGAHLGRGDVLANRIPVAAGRHRVQLSYRLGRKQEAGVAEVQVDVPDGAECRLDYKTPMLLLWRKGKITVNPEPWLPPTVFVELGTSAG